MSLHTLIPYQMTAKALEAYHATSIDQSPHSKALLKLVTKNNQEFLITVQKPTSLTEKISYYVDLFWNRQDYTLTAIVRHVKRLHISDNSLSPAVELLNEKIKKYTMLHPQESLSIIVKGNSIPEQDQYRLTDKEWLNDEIINRYFEILNDRNSLCLSTFFLEKLHSSGVEGVKRWTKDANITKFKRILVPINVNKNHWCLASINLEKKQFEYYDSLQSGDLQNSLASLRNWFTKTTKQDVTHWQDKVMTDIPKQNNDVDCGVFCCQYARALTSDEPMTFSQATIGNCRKDMYQQLLERKKL